MVLSARAVGGRVAAPWHPWEYALDFEGETSQQVGGYATRYANNNFTFITVRGGTSPPSMIRATT